ncbi:hypothetical protein R6Q59_014821 [Mikania micrantha]
MEIDVGRVLPASVSGGGGRDKKKTRNYKLSNAQKSMILGYITITKSVPQMVADAWDSDEWNYFSDQCYLRDLDPDYVIFDNDEFMDDKLMVEEDTPMQPSSGKTCMQSPISEVVTTTSISEPKQRAITNALKSSARAVKASDMMRWSVGEWLFFKDQVYLLGLDMNYAVEDVEEEENCMSSFMCGHRKH